MMNGGHAETGMSPQRREGRRELLVDLAVCSDEDLRCIIATDPGANKAYKRELEARAARSAEVDYWEWRTNL